MKLQEVLLPALGNKLEFSNVVDNSSADVSKTSAATKSASENTSKLCGNVPIGLEPLMVLMLLNILHKIFD